MCKTITIDNAYKSVERMVYKKIQNFLTYYKQVWDEGYEEAAMMAATEAMHDYNPEKGALTTHVYWKVHYALLNHRNQRIKEGSLIREPEDPHSEESMISQLPGRRCFDCERFLLDMSDDAATVARLIIEMPLDLLQLVRMRGKEEDPEVVQGALATTLREWGWPWNRIMAAWREVGENLA